MLRVNDVVTIFLVNDVLNVITYKQGWVSLGERQRFIAILKNVPAGVCQVCGEQYFKADIIKEMERVVQLKEEAKETIQVPVRELQMT